MQITDLVALQVPVPDQGLDPGTVGTIVAVFDQPRAYEVEFVDGNGNTTIVTLLADQIQLVARGDGTVPPPGRSQV